MNVLAKSLAQMADERPRPVSEGYVAERHPLRDSLILVWGPCSCCWVICDKTQESFLTTCGTQECSFLWSEALETLGALRLAERPAEKPVPPPEKLPEEAQT